MVDGLTFDEAKHEYRYNGVVVPSVTQILGGLASFNCSPEVLAAAADRGTDVHRACELDVAGTLDEGSVTSEVWPYLDAFRLWVREMQPQIHSMEDIVYHPVLRYAGTRDILATCVGSLWTVDIKTSAQASPLWGLQTAGYMLADVAHDKTKRAALQLGRNGKYKWLPYTDPNDARVFASLVTLYHWAQSKL